MKKAILFIGLMMLSGCKLLEHKTDKLERKVARIADDVCDYIPPDDVERFFDGVNEKLSGDRAILVDCGK